MRAALHRIDEVSQALYRPSNVSGLQDTLAQAAIATLGAAGHTAQVKKLNEEGMLILATIRILNRLFIDAMEDKVKSGSEDFSNRLIAISKLATLPNEDRRILELYIALVYGSPGEERIMPFECAKREGIFKQRIEKIEHEINTEYETQRAAFARRVWQIDIKKILKENVIMYNNDRRKRGEPKCNEYNIQEERKTLQYFRSHAIEQYERGKMPESEIRFGLTELFTLLETIGKDFKPLVRRQPQDFTVRLDSSLYAQGVRNDLTTRGYEGIVESIDALTKLCALLAKSENHLQVKSRQRGQKPVQTRTIADMTNEMEGELTELPKYTAYANVLQGKEIWKGKIETNPLTDKINTPPKYIRSLTNDLGCTRKEIEEAIRTRQDSWRPRIEEVGETEPEVPKSGEKKEAKKKPKKETKPSKGPPPTSYH